MQVLITGGSGRLGRILLAAWSDKGTPGFQPVWSSRHSVGPRHLIWDILSSPAPKFAEGATILHLAGVLRGDAAALAANATLALKVCAAAKSAKAKHVFLASSASVYGASQCDHLEVQAPAPCTDYGRAKQDMEREALCWAHNAGPDAPGVTCLRIGNVLGADALVGQATAGRDIVLDPVQGQPGGPQRSYIGPMAFAQVLAELLVQVRAGVLMPSILNVAAPNAVFMADLLKAADAPFHFGPPNARVIPKVSLCTTKLSAMVSLNAANAVAMIADWRSLSDRAS